MAQASILSTTCPGNAAGSEVLGRYGYYPRAGATQEAYARGRLPVFLTSWGAFNISGQWQIIFQGEEDDHAGTAVWIGQLYSNLPQVVLDGGYTNEEFVSELSRLNAARFSPGDRIRVSALASAHFLVDLFASIPPAILPAIRTEFSLSLSRAGLVMAAMYITCNAVQPLNSTEDTWWILDGKDYPRPWWELIPEN